MLTWGFLISVLFCEFGLLIANMMQFSIIVLDIKQKSTGACWGTYIGIGESMTRL